MAKFYISDLHLGHANIMRHSKRKFSDVDEMDQTFIDNWNSVVTDNDEVYIVGDFSYKSRKNAVEYLKLLKGKKYLITGNHDKHIVKDPVARRMFVEIRDRMTVDDNGTLIVLDHFPELEWDGFFRGTLHFYGHIHNNVEHNTYKIMKTIKNAYNVGTDILGYYPRTKEDVIKYNNEFNAKN